MEKVRAGDIVKCECGGIFRVASVNAAEAIAAEYHKPPDHLSERNAHPIGRLTVVGRLFEAS